MKQLQRIVMIALALLLVAVPAVTLAQSSSGSATDKPAASDKATDKPSTPSASPGAGSTGTGTGAGQASPAMPASADDCKNNGWQKFGAKSEAECLAKVKK